MSNRYSFVDSLNNVYALPDDIVLRTEDATTIDISVIERSFRDGAVYPGLIRQKSKEIVFDLPIYKTTDADYRTLYNTLMKWFLKTVKIKDTILNITTNVLPNTSKIKFDNGSFLRSSDNSISFKQLTPFWEAIAYTTQTILGTANPTTATITIANNGYIETPLLITLTNPYSVINNATFSISENNQGINIVDPIFGTNFTDVLIIDNDIGQVTLNNTKRNQFITAGTGWFMLPIDSGTLYYNLNGKVDIEIAYKARYYL